MCKMSKQKKSVGVFRTSMYRGVSFHVKLGKKSIHFTLTGIEVVSHKAYVFNLKMLWGF